LTRLTEPVGQVHVRLDELIETPAQLTPDLLLL
jgi:hypothetical protein